MLPVSEIFILLIAVILLALCAVALCRKEGAQ